MERITLLLMIPVALAGLAAIGAPFGTTILGLVAIGKIRRSAGKLYGLPLAVFDALLFPLLLLDGLILVVVAAVVMFGLSILAVLYNSPAGAFAKLMAILPEALTLGIGLPIIAWVDYRIVRIVWHKLTEFESPPKPIAAASDAGQGCETSSAER